MTRSVKIRLLLFLTLAVVGILYVGGTYLGVVDKALGRGVAVSMDLPASGGLYVGSEVDYRGLKIGKVSAMDLTPAGVRVTLALHSDARVPRDAEVQVADLSAVGEQYVNFLPTHDAGPYLADGDRIDPTNATLPPSTDKLLESLDSFTTSVNPDDLRTVVSELGTMFQGNAENLRQLVDSGDTLIGAALDHEDSTLDLLQSGQQVLKTQQAHSDDIQSFARGLKQVTATLKSSDPQLRDIIQGGPETLKQVQSLVDGLNPVLPQFISNLVTVNQVLTARLPALEQVLVTFPLSVKNALIGTPGDNYAHINLQFTYTSPPCTKGYMPASQWADPTDLRQDVESYPAKCTDPRAQPGYTGSDPIVQRGVNLAPAVDDSDPIYHVNPYASLSRKATDADGSDVTIAPTSGSGSGSSTTGPLSILGSDAWQSMLIGPVSRGQ
ncbi:MCE family protein [Nocardioides sp. Kera G14]|uniref:MCE family protein n=1 Tax=Nocardioides sp. Kera G14 TaxID=2884264 RepID=UPI001D1080EE|nr:MlaD family protein [Nocardioides sp. Kera G14]UDY22302.1 MCE family protein [Nocardioides sp. Kera G14]